MVNFDNVQCKGTIKQADEFGTCFTADECTTKGGFSIGNCASGFGICCLFTISGTTGLTVSQNNTYIQNPSFPSVYTDTTALSYTVNKCADSE